MCCSVVKKRIALTNFSLYEKLKWTNIIPFILKKIIHYGSPFHQLKYSKMHGILKWNEKNGEKCDECVFDQFRSYKLDNYKIFAVFYLLWTLTWTATATACECEM